MRRGLVTTSSILLVLVFSSWLIVDTARPTSGPTYTLAQLRAALERNPSAVVGATLRISGTAGGVDRTDSVRGPVIALRDIGDANGLKAPLLLHPELGNGIIPALRHVPLLGALMPAPQTVSQSLATYRIRIQAFSLHACHGDVFSCYYGALLDADSSA